MAPKAKKAVKKSAKMSHGKKMGEVKPLTRVPTESVSFTYTKPVVVYTPQKPDGSA
jgi:hypothetical protein